MRTYPAAGTKLSEQPVDLSAWMERTSRPLAHSIQISDVLDEMVASREHQSGRVIWRLYNGMAMMWYVLSSARILCTDLWKFHNDNQAFQSGENNFRWGLTRYFNAVIFASR